MRKTFHVLFYIISTTILLRVWIINPEAIVVAYGLIGAGVAISLQDFFKNFTGGIIIFTTGTFHVGDRIEISDKRGDVLDIGIMYTKVIEIGEWIDGDQATGRVVAIPNGHILTNVVHNYSKDHSYLWDEIPMSISPDSNISSAKQIMLTIALEETHEFTEKADRSLHNLSENYYLGNRCTSPEVYVTVTDQWVVLRIRYVTSVWERREVRSALYSRIFTELKKAEDIHIVADLM